VNPALHKQSVGSSLPISENDAKLHVTQKDSFFAPVTVEYLPAAQSEHMFGPSKVSPNMDGVNT